MILEGEDGVTHINIYSKGKTHLGRWLSNFSYSPITMDEYGSFLSIEGLWYFLLTQDERLRKLTGYKAKAQGRISPYLPIFEAHDIEFQRIIKIAINKKLTSSKGMLKEFLASSLPFCHYYCFSDKKVDAGYEWIVEHIEKARSLLKTKYATHSICNR